MHAYLALRGEIAAFDAWSLGAGFETPLVFLQGDLDHYTPTAEVCAYARHVTAPAVRVVSVPGGGHSAVFMRDPFLTLVRQHTAEVRQSSV
jgi:pimeloyl-ACP methyl ester carboxylesterase